MRIEPPKMDRSCITENLFEKERREEMDVLSVNEEKKKKRQEDESLFNNQDFKFPSQQYYIYFDKGPSIEKKQSPHSVSVPMKRKLK